MALLDAFDALRLKSGYVLRSYQFASANGSHNHTFAVPEDAPCPDPSECMRTNDRGYSYPHVPESLDDLLSVVEGDGSAWSYLQASIMYRELVVMGETGGQGWAGAKLVERPPNYPADAPIDFGSLSSFYVESDWKCLYPPKHGWEPFVRFMPSVRGFRLDSPERIQYLVKRLRELEQGSYEVAVMFHAHTHAGGERIFCGEDIYSIGNYAYYESDFNLAIGPELVEAGDY